MRSPLLLTGFVLAACGAGDAKSSGATALKAPAIGAAAPALALADLDDRPVSLAALKDTVVVLNVWATWCQPCRLETPELVAVQRQFAGQPFAVVGVSIDNAGAGPDIRDFVREFDVPYRIWLDPQKNVQTKFLTMGVPETFVIGKDGTIRARLIGGMRAGDTTLVAAVRRALGA